MPKRTGAPRRAGLRTPSRAPSFPVAYVRYHDHCWLDASDLEKIRRAEPYVVEETGFLLVETPAYITLSKERSTDGEKGRLRYGDVTIIMRSDILDFEILGTPRANGREGVASLALAANGGHRATGRKRQGREPGKRTACPRTLPVPTSKSRSSKTRSS